MAVVADELLALVGNVRADSGEPVQGRARDWRRRVAAVVVLRIEGDGPSLTVIGEPGLGEGGMEDVGGQALQSCSIVRLDDFVRIDREPGMSPAQEELDRVLGDLL